MLVEENLVYSIIRSVDPDPDDDTVTEENVTDPQTNSKD